MTVCKQFILITLLGLLATSCNLYEEPEKTEGEDTDDESLSEGEGTDSDKKKANDESKDTDKQGSKDTDKQGSKDTDKQGSKDTDKQELKDSDEPESTDPDEPESTDTDPKEKDTDCKDGELKCKGKCVPDDIDNCGECGHDCTALPHVGGKVKCTYGACILTKSSCEDGWAHCSKDAEDGCETNITEASNCGECGNDCTETSKKLCAEEGDGYECASDCKSNAPTLCGDTCVNTDENTLHCGKCNNECESFEGGRPVCEDGKCDFECVDSSDLKCDDGCFPDDDENCGECGNNCEEDDKVCDGKGDCVECMDEGDCTRGDANVCIKNKCKQCESGSCCDEDNNYLPDSHPCKTMETEYRCEGKTACGAEAQELVKKIYCSGKSPECDGSPEGSWDTIEYCDGELCKLSNSGASCMPCDHGCSTDSGKCWSDCNPKKDNCCGEDGTIACLYDSKTSLYWQDPKASGLHKWQEAEDYCSRLSLARRTSWFLPSRDDFIDILGDCDSWVYDGETGFCDTCSASSTCKSLFGGDDSKYWASDRSSSLDFMAMFADFNDGYMGEADEEIGLSVRCVHH